MKKSGLFTTFIIGLLMLSGIPTKSLGNGLVISASSQDSSVNNANEIVFTIPVGDNGIHYEGDENTDMMRWGPTALSVAPDGTFWIADAPDNHILHFDSAGKLIDKISTDKFAVGIGDLEVTSSGIWLLDMASIPPKLVQLTLDGKVQNAYYLPKGLYLEDGLTGISLGNDGSVIIERGGGYTTTRFISSSGELDQKDLEGYEFKGEIYLARPADLSLRQDVSRGYILVGTNRINVEVPNILGGLMILRINSDGGFFVIVEEVVLNSAFQVDQKVYRYDSFGNLDGIARVPVSSEYTYVAQGIAVGPENEVYALITKSDSGEVQKLEFYNDLPPILTSPMSTEEIMQSHAMTDTLVTCRSRESMISVVLAYKNNLTDLDSYHIDDPYNECNTRTKPHYLGSAGTYTSVPYAWNQWDNIIDFNNFMNQSGFFAGDIDEPNSNCSRGIDCSGLVSRAWGLSDHTGTYGLEDISIELLNVYQLQPGDIMNRWFPLPGHTIIFDSFWGNGMSGYEATIYLNFDRVVMTNRLFSSISDFTPRRYDNVCHKVHLPIVIKNLIQENSAFSSSSIYPSSDPYPPPFP